MEEIPNKRGSTNQEIKKKTHLLRKNNLLSRDVTNSDDLLMKVNKLFILKMSLLSKGFGCYLRLWCLHLEVGGDYQNLNNDKQKKL